jgi:hypothetical protein
MTNNVFIIAGATLESEGSLLQDQPAFEHCLPWLWRSPGAHDRRELDREDRPTAQHASRNREVRSHE